MDHKFYPVYDEQGKREDPFLERVVNEAMRSNKPIIRNVEPEGWVDENGVKVDEVDEDLDKHAKRTATYVQVMCAAISVFLVLAGALIVKGLVS